VLISALASSTVLSFETNEQDQSNKDQVYIGRRKAKSFEGRGGKGREHFPASNSRLGMARQPNLQSLPMDARRTAKAFWALAQNGLGGSWCHACGLIDAFRRREKSVICSRGKGCMVGTVGIELQRALKTRKSLILRNGKTEKNRTNAEPRYTADTRNDRENWSPCGRYDYSRIMAFRHIQGWQAGKSAAGT
jgi:hypothetical protein